MEISSENLGNLLLLNDVTIENLRAMCKYFLQSLITGTSSALDSEDLERELSALSTFLLEAAKMQSTAEALRIKLAQSGANDQVLTIVADVYEKYHPMIFSHINSIGISVPAIVGLSWRLDHALEGGCEVPLFLITLKVADRGIIRNIEMLANRESLQDILYKVKDAVKQADRVLTSLKG